MMLQQHISFGMGSYRQTHRPQPSVRQSMVGFIDIEQKRQGHQPLHIRDKDKICWPLAF
jgi:hypothetical protein